MMGTDYSNKENVELYTEKPLVQEFVLEPAFLKLIGKPKGKKILDLGCGAGYLSRTLSKSGAKVTAIDISKEFIEKAKSLSEGYDIDFRVMDGAELSDLESDYYDFVIMNMVFVNVSSTSKATEIVDEVSRVLDTDGCLLFSDLHPISYLNLENATERRNYGPNFSYFEDGANFISEVKMSNGKIMNFNDTHHTMESYTEMLEKASMYVHRIIEPHAIDSAPQEMKKQKFPEMILFCCKLFDE